MSAFAWVAHVAANHVLVVRMGLGLTGSAMALCSTYTFMVAFLVFYAVAARLTSRVWGSRDVALPTWGEVKDFASLGYSSIGMRAIEYYAYTYLTILAGFLPSPDVT